MRHDLEADILPIIAREVPELPRPLKKWGAPWLVRDVLAARDQRLGDAISWGASAGFNCSVWGYVGNRR